jgi:hypothetical protein
MGRHRIWFAGGRTHPKCCDGAPDSDVCHDLRLLEAEESDFHDRRLIDATEAINEIFMRLDERPPPDRHLALLNTGLGLLLVWAEAVPRPDDISQSSRTGVPRRRYGKRSGSWTSPRPKALPQEPSPG